MENLRARMNLRLINSASEEKLKKLVAQPSFLCCQIFNEDLVGVHNQQINLTLNKPIYAGQAILDLSKRLMYEFHYKVMKPQYGDKINLLFTDTGMIFLCVCLFVTVKAIVSFKFLIFLIVFSFV